MILYRMFLFSGEISLIVIDTFSVSPGPRVLSIEYTDIAGVFKSIDYIFFGRIRPREYFILSY